MILKQYEGFIFDLDGTLFDSSHVWEQIDVDFLSKRGLSVPDDYCAAISAFGLRETAEYTIRRFSLNETPEMLINEWTQMAQNAYSCKISVFPFVREFLSYLRSNGKKIAVATTNHKNLYIPALRNNNIEVFIDAFSDADIVGSGKEKPDIYLYAANKLGLSPSNCIVFEDVEAGLRSAKEAGFTTVAAALYGSLNESILRYSDYVVTEYESLCKEFTVG